MRTRLGGDRSEQLAAERSTPAGAGDDEARPVLVGGIRKRLGRVTVLDVHALERAAEPRGQHLGVPGRPSAVVGAVVGHQHGPGLAQRGVRGHDHDGAGRVGGERSGHAAVEEPLETLAGRGSGHHQRGLRVRRALADGGHRAPRSARCR